MASPILRPLAFEDLSQDTNDPVDPVALGQARTIVDGIKCVPTGDRAEALLKVARSFKDIEGTSVKYTVGKDDLKSAYEGLSAVERESLDNIHARVLAFATAQRRSIVDMEMDIPGGKAGHVVSPCDTAGCYAPGGRYPLPSSVLMTAVTARAAGCPNVIVASPRPAPITLAAAYVAGADLFVCVGGAQAIASMAYGVAADANNPAIPPCNVIVGPGNKWVTAAKSLVSGHCGIDMLAGPSEVLVICDDTADAAVVAADLIAQAEHDIVARPLLVSTSQAMIDEINAATATQVEALPEPNRSTAREAFKGGFSILCDSIESCIAASDHIAPEHLEIQTREADAVGRRCGNYGGLFIGVSAAEVLGDYGAGPNHTLPTGGTGKYTGGLSVFNFLRIRTWMRIDDAPASQKMVEECVTMARLEGLEGHARAAEARRLGGDGDRAAKKAKTDDAGESKS